MDWNQWDRIRIGDGAVGTRLQEMTGRAMACPESMVLETEGRRLLEAMHAEYIAAGAEWIETHTFAANPWQLQAAAMEAHCEAINRLAVETARAAARHRGVPVLGSIGPLDRRVSGEPPPASEWEACYRPQFRALVAAGIDGFILETFARPLEAEAALRCAAETGLPFLFTIGGQSVARAFARQRVAELVKLADRLGACVIGLNCLPPYDISRLLPLVAEHTRRPLMAMPNAGTPQVLRGCVHYELSADDLLREAGHWVQLGVAVLGGCCGTRPSHIRALAERFSGSLRATRTEPAATRIRVTVVDRSAPAVSPTESVAYNENPIRRRLQHTTPALIAVEVRPALHRAFSQTLARLAPVAAAGPDFFDIPDNPGANPGRNSLVCSHLLQQAYRIPVIAHCNPTQANALRLTADLLSAADLGVRGILAVSGDSPHIGPFDRHATRVHDVRNAVELLQLLTLMRQGEMINGQPLETPADFCTGCGLAPALSLTSQITWLERKIDAGAEYVFTQPVFDRDSFQRLMTALRPRIRIPVFVGVFPVVSARQAAFLQAGKIPGIVLPEKSAAAITRFEKPDDQAAAGMAAAKTLIHELTTPFPDGFYLVMPFHARGVAMTADLVAGIRGIRS